MSILEKLTKDVEGIRIDCARMDEKICNIDSKVNSMDTQINTIHRIIAGEKNRQIGLYQKLLIIFITAILSSGALVGGAKAIQVITSPPAITQAQGK